MFGQEYAVLLGLDTDIFIGTSVLNCQTLKKLFLHILPAGKIWAYMDTDILIGTSVLNYQTLKTLFLQILEIKMIFSRKLGGIHFFSSICGQNMSLYGQILPPKQYL